MSRGYVYVIKPHLKVGGRPVVKIGRTTRSPHTRLRELTTALPSGASLSYFAEFPDVKWAEARLHEVLGEQRVTEGGGTEFFYLSVTEAVTIVQTLAYRVSQVEAMAALKRDLESYLDTLGGGIRRKVRACILFAAWIVISLVGSASTRASMGSSPFNWMWFLWGGIIVLIFVSDLADWLSRRFVGQYFRADVVRERERLLVKYPAANGATTANLKSTRPAAARKTARLVNTRQGELDL